MATGNVNDLGGLERLIVPVILILLVVVGFLIGLSTGVMLISIAVVFFPVAIFLLQNMHYWLIFLYFAQMASLTLPGIPQELGVYEIMASGFIIAMIARFAQAKKASYGGMFRVSNLFAILYTSIVLVHMIIRGTGLRVLGSPMWGGMSYVENMLNLGVLLLAGHVYIKDRHWVLFVFVMLIGSSLPATAQIVFQLSYGKIWWQYHFIKVQSWALIGGLMAASTFGSGLIRINFMAAFAKSFLMLGYILSPWFLLPGILALVLVMSLLSGHRIAIVQLVIIIFIHQSIYWRKNTILRLFTIGVIGLMFIVILTPFIPMMPLPFQRALSFVPFYDISYIAKHDAKQSLEWRWEIYKIMFENLGQFWLVGRGFAYYEREAQVIDLAYYASPHRYYEIHSYHAFGPLSILIDLGVFGVIAAYGFIISSIIEFWKRRNIFSPKSRLFRYYAYFMAFYLMKTIYFTFLFSDSKQSVPSLFLSSVVIRCLITTQMRKQVQKT